MHVPFLCCPPFLALQDGGMAVLEACSTKVMRWLAFAHGFLQRVHHTSGKGCSQPVTLLLSVPVFHASNLAFKLSYMLNQFRLRRIGLKNPMLRVDDLLIKVDGLSLNLSHRMKAYEALGNIACRAQAGDCRSDRTNVRSSLPY